MRADHGQPPKRLGILTFHRCINYGSYWQARSLAEGLSRMGARVELLDHDSRAVKWAEWRCALGPILPRPGYSDVPAYAAKTRKFLEAFDRLPLSEAFPLEAPEQLGEYDAIVVGSDEVWNLRHPWYGGRDIFYGAGLNSPRLVSYAASFGNQNASDGLSEHWRRQLQSFAAISVRDDNSRRIIRAALDHEPELVLDPCLQFPAAIAACEGNAKESAGYIALYGHGFPDWFGRAIRHWADRNDRAIVSIGYRNDWADEQRLSAGPGEFAQLIGRSEAVITNFFHGCVFSLIHGLPFATVPSDYRRNKVHDLMEALDMPERIATPGTSARDYARLLAEPPGSATVHRIAQLRDRSDAFLRRALDLGG